MKSNNAQKEKFTIIVRLRPTLKEDYNSYKDSEIQTVLQNDNNNSVIIQRKNNEQKTFRFNHVFDPATQSQIYEKSSHLIQALFQGYNSTFLAYGQTGTGKTHTIFGEGTKIDQGFFAKSVQDIFAIIKRRMHERQFAVRVSFIEFYLDNIYDLIQNNNRKLQIKEGNQEGIHIKDLTQIPVKSAEDLFNSVRQAIKYRKTQQTSINKRSSRSHAVIQITLLQRWNEKNETKYLKGVLKIVDLAGSERVSKTESSGSRLEEAKRINKQITTLGKCINLLAQIQKQNKLINTDILNKFNYNKAHIPFRDSKITRFLSQSLEGKSKIILCVCVSKFAVHLEESFSSLIFASQASTLKIDSKRNDVYTMSSKSIDKPAYSTPIKSKSELKKKESNQSNQNDIEKYVNQINSSSRDQGMKNIANGPKLVEKFKKEISQINNYLKTREMSTKEQSKEILQANLIAMNKIFLILRNQNNTNQF